MDLIKCEICLREVERNFVKRIFGYHDKYKCNGDALEACHNHVREQQKQKDLEEKEKENLKQEQFNKEYLDYINENNDKFIMLPSKYQYRDSHTRYYDPEKELVFKKHIKKDIWMIDEKLSKFNFNFLL